MSKKNKQLLVVGLIALVVLAGALIFVFRGQLFQSASVQSPADTAKVDEQVNISSSNYQRYAEMTGETYDRNFIANMIAHHQGAVDMAKMAQQRAKHQELKTMADDIIAAQQKEIADMTAWQMNWGYPPTAGDTMMDHSAMGMMHDMASMTAQLEGKTGDEFDKAFIEQMIMHHQSAIDMAAPGRVNAHHQEVKNLTKAIVSAQTKEIQQMKQWQAAWGYNQ